MNGLVYVVREGHGNCSPNDCQFAALLAELDAATAMIEGRSLPVEAANLHAVIEEILGLVGHETTAGLRCAAALLMVDELGRRLATLEREAEYCHGAKSDEGKRIAELTAEIARLKAEAQASALDMFAMTGRRDEAVAALADARVAFIREAKRAVRDALFEQSIKRVTESHTAAMGALDALAAKKEGP